jgi:phosphopantothenoylcysteine decarboxylase
MIVNADVGSDWVRRSGERTRLACCARRLAERGSEGLGETPKPACETQALPGPTSQIKKRTEKPMPRLLFAFSGSIACYKACHALSRLVQAGVEVRVVATPTALRFVGAPTLEGLSGHPVFDDLWTPGRAMDHISLARWADLALVAPATAHTLNRLASGQAGDPIGALFLAWELARKPWWVAPAMNHAMLAHPVTTASIQKLTTLGVRVLPPGEGAQACGETGSGRLIEPELLVREVLAAFAASSAVSAASSTGARPTTP